MPIFLAHVAEQFPEELAIVGRLVVGYGELEFGLSMCLGAVLEDDDKAARIFYRVPGESARVSVADAFLRDSFSKVGLKAKYEEMIGAIRFCTKVRNQFAHCHWRVDGAGWLMFGNMEKGAEGMGDMFIPFTPINIDVLSQQERFFSHTDDLLEYLWREYAHQAGRPSTQRFLIPPTVEAPRRDNLLPKPKDRS